MNFSEVYNLILESCPFLSGNLYDGIIVKKLAATNTISDTGSSHQSHMAFTGKQKDFFPFLEADGYFNVGYDNKDDDLKKYFTLRLPLNIYADNVNFLSGSNSPIQFESKKKIVKASVLRSRRNGQEDQVELSIKSLDDADFIEFRKLLRVNDFFILLKKKSALEYDLVGIKGDDKNSAKLAMCTDFYKNATQTPVDLDSFACAFLGHSPALKNCLVYPLVDISFLKGLNEAQIVDVLAEKLKEERQSPRGTQYYGFKYAIALSKFEKNVVDRIIKKANISDSLYSEVDKGRGVFERAAQDGKIISSKDFQLSKTEKEDGDDFVNLLKLLEQEIEKNPERIDALRKLLPPKNDEGKITIPSSLSTDFSPTQIIYYGVPGCGKSWKVNNDIDAELAKYGITEKDEHKVRCVFHPEYSNADFVGQIYPYVLPDNKGVEYRFKPGPFAEVVRRAYLNPDKPYFLIIEEINRGNAAAIFGEMFQLLDRIELGDDPDKSTENTYNKGWSSYGVDNIDVNAYIRQNKTNVGDTITYAESVTYDNQVSFKLNTAIRLPPNLSVYATMNTSDQNVFTMDNAFQRRFKSKMIRNSLEDTAQSDLKIGDTGVRWGDFRNWINAKILAPETGLNKAEDKCLGGWFIKGEKKTDQNGNTLNECKDFPKDDFAEKVLKYLWNDVFKRNAAEKVFLKDKVTSLTNLIEQFESGKEFAAFENVFVINEADKAKLLSQKTNP